MAKKRVELTEGEWAIMQAVWAHQPCAAPTIQEVLLPEKNWSYSTVKTMMDRMVKKGLLQTERIRNLILYSATVTRKEAQKREVMRAVKQAFDGAFTPMMQFLLDNHSLSEDELERLEAMVRERKQKAKSRK